MILVLVQLFVNTTGSGTDLTLSGDIQSQGSSVARLREIEFDTQIVGPDESLIISRQPH